MDQLDGFTFRSVNIYFAFLIKYRHEIGCVVTKILRFQMQFAAKHVENISGDDAQMVENDGKILNYLLGKV